WLYRMLFGPDPLTERLVLMWHNHFASSAAKVGMAVRRQNEIFREFARAPFGELLKRVVRDPALLVWLDAQVNRKGHPNENLGRELMELFTLGIGHYTERDIQESARAFTGWGIGRTRPEEGRPPSATFVFRPRQHDDGDKTFFGQTGPFGGEDILKMLTDNPRTSEYVASKMWRFFAYPDPEPELVSRLAAIFRQSGLEIKSLLRAIITSPEFYSERAERAIYKNPVDFVIVTARQMGLGELLGASEGSGLRGLGPMTQVNQALKGMGMQLFYPPDVAGWDQGAAWITTATMVERIGWADRLFPSRPGQRAVLPLDAYGLFEADPSAEGVVSKLVSLFDAPLPESKRRGLLDAAVKASGGRVGRENANATASAVARLIFAAPEFQFC
ncbi:MAG: DUF1800 domain-containing protein, partial [Fimbriimonas ginsengisoli]|nr:DUF1800 domain-containing protein [Fimbriimonas ginsengisoli]